QSRGHRRGPRPPALGRARAMDGHGLRKRLAQARMRQYKVVIALEQHELMLQALLALAERLDSASDGRHALTDVEIEPVQSMDRSLCPPLLQNPACVFPRTRLLSEVSIGKGIHPVHNIT